MIDKTAFTSNKTLAQQYLERKAAKIEADLAETIKESSRVLMNQNKIASRKGNYVGAGSYFGNVPMSPRKIGSQKTMGSIVVTKTNVPAEKSAKAPESIIPENSINFIA